MGVKSVRKYLGTGKGGQFAPIIIKIWKKMTNPTGPRAFFQDILYPISQIKEDILIGLNLELHRLDPFPRFEATVQLQIEAAGKILGWSVTFGQKFVETSSWLDSFFELTTPNGGECRKTDVRSQFFSVVAENQHGQSLPSYYLLVMTLSRQQARLEKQEMRKNVDEVSFTTPAPLPTLPDAKQCCRYGH